MQCKIRKKETIPVSLILKKMNIPFKKLMPDTKKALRKAVQEFIIKPAERKMKSDCRLIYEEGMTTREMYLSQKAFIDTHIINPLVVKNFNRLSVLKEFFENQ